MSVKQDSLETESSATTSTNVKLEEYVFLNMRCVSIQWAHIAANVVEVLGTWYLEAKVPVKILMSARKINRVM